MKYDIDEYSNSCRLSQNAIEMIKAWCGTNLTGVPHDTYLTIIDQQNIRVDKVQIYNKLEEFPFRFRDVYNIYLSATEELKSFKNFPISSRDFLTITFHAKSTKPIMNIDFVDLPLYEDVGDLSFKFSRIPTITTAHLSKYVNLKAVSMSWSNHEDLYDLAKYDIKTQEYRILPTRRFKNLSEFITNRKFVTHYIAIEDGVAYTEKECDFLNDLFAHYNVQSKLREQYAMDFVVKLIEGGFENEV